MCHRLHRTLAVGLVALVLWPMPGRAGAQAAPTVFAPGIVSVEGLSLYRGAFSPDGSEFYFFRKVTPDQEDYRIYVTRRRGDAWSPATRVVLGGEFSDLYPTIAPDGRHMVFTSYRPAPGDTSSHPNANLWYTERAVSGWGAPVYMAAASTLANYDAGPVFVGNGAVRFVSTEPDWRTRHIRVTRWDGMRFGTPSPADSQANLLAPWAGWRRGEVFIWNGLPSPDGRFMILEVSEVQGRRRQPPDLWVTFREGTGWREPRRLDGADGPGTENFMLFSPDGRDLFFVRDFAIYYRLPVSQILALR